MAAKFNLKSIVRVPALGLALTLLIPASFASAQDIKVYRDEIRQYQIRVDQLKSQEHTRYNSEMSQLSSWIDESLILIGKDETDKVRTLSLKIGVYLDFVEASVARDKAMGEAMEAESKLKALKAEYGKLEAQVQQLTAEEEVLQAKLNSMQK
jgi:hypothetical protein